METSTLVDRVYETLKMRILRQEFTLGQKLNLTSLAKELNVSNTPLREAISRLEKVGLVKIIPYRGPYVRGLSAAEVAESYDVRIVLESLAARLVAASLTPTTLARIGSIHRRYEQAFEDDDKTRVRQLDMEFHVAIAQASGNTTLIDFLQMLSDWVTVFMQFRLPPSRPPAVLIGEHHRILEALRVRDKDRAGEAMQQHLIAGKEDLIQHLASQLEESPKSSHYPNIW